MSKKCRAYSASKLGLEPADNSKAFYAGWDAAIEQAEKQGTTVARTYEELPKNTYPDKWEESEALYTTPPAQPAVPEGWKLVPVNPTPEMLAAADQGDRDYTLRNFGNVQTVMQGPEDHYAAMIAAAQPAQPQRTEQEPETFEQWNAKQHGDPEEIGFLQALRIAYIAGQDSMTTPPAQPEQEPVAWSRASFIEDDDGRQIGTDDPDLAWGKEPPDAVGWSPLCYCTPPAAQLKPLIPASLAEQQFERYYRRGYDAGFAAQRKPLTDEQILSFGPGQPDAVWSYEDQLYFARAIEAAHGIKENNT